MKNGSNNLDGSCFLSSHQAHNFGHVKFADAAIGARNRRLLIETVSRAGETVSWIPAAKHLEIIEVNDMGGLR